MGASLFTGRGGDRQALPAAARGWHEDAAVELADRVCVITGAASGIGAAGARRFAAAGARVVVADLKAEAAHAIAAEIGGLAFPTDVADEAAVEALVAGTLARFGRLDLLWANAGIAGVRAPCAEQPAESWDHVLGSI